MVQVSQYLRKQRYRNVFSLTFLFDFEDGLEHVDEEKRQDWMTILENSGDFDISRGNVIIIDLMNCTTIYIN